MRELIFAWFFMSLGAAAWFVAATALGAMRDRPRPQPEDFLLEENGLDGLRPILPGHPQIRSRPPERPPGVLGAARRYRQAVLR